MTNNVQRYKQKKNEYVKDYFIFKASLVQDRQIFSKGGYQKISRNYNRDIYKCFILRRLRPEININK